MITSEGSMLRPDLLYRIPNRDISAGEITHKLPSQMNRHEKRLVISACRRAAIRVRNRLLTA